MKGVIVFEVRTVDCFLNRVLICKITTQIPDTFVLALRSPSNRIQSMKYFVINLLGPSSPNFCICAKEFCQLQKLTSIKFERNNELMEHRALLINDLNTRKYN